MAAVDLRMRRVLKPENQVHSRTVGGGKGAGESGRAHTHARMRAQVDSIVCGPPGHSYFLTAASDGVVATWDARTLEPRTVLQNVHTSRPMLYAGGSSMVRLHDRVHTPAPVPTTPPPQLSYVGVTDMELTPYGLLTVGRDGQVRLTSTTGMV